MSEKDLLERNEAWEQAIFRRDPNAADAVVAEGFALVFVHPVKASVSREQWMAMLPDYVVHEWNVQERVVDISGDTASIMQRIGMKATVAGEDRSGPFVISDTWRHMDGNWQVWRRHSTPLQTGILSVPEP
jgi:ketosteroid isomerase-like protein